MKFEGHMQIGSNQSGKGDVDRSIKDGRKKFRENFDSIFKGVTMKFCSGCKKMKAWKYHIVDKNGNHYFCEECKEAYKQHKKGK